MTFSYRYLAVKIRGIGGIIVKQNVIMRYLIQFTSSVQKKVYTVSESGKDFLGGAPKDHERQKNYEPFLWMPCKRRNRNYGIGKTK